MPSAEELTGPSSIDEWRARNGILVELPSGVKARVRRTLDLLPAIKNGHIPNPLAGILRGMLQGSGPAIDLRTLDEESFVQMVDYMNEVCCSAMLQPRCEQAPVDADATWMPSEGAISVNEIAIEDRVFIFHTAQGGAADLATFREQQTRALESLQDGGRVQGKTKRTAGHK